MAVKNELSVGIVFIIGMLILGYFTIIMSDDLFDPHEYYKMTVIFPSIEGLGSNDKVRINGVLSGNVEETKLVNNMVLVTMKVFNTFTLYENYRITIKNETALAGKYVSINPGTRYDKEGKELAVITTRENLDGRAIKDPFTLLSDFVEENRGNIQASLQNIREITDKINSGRGTLGSLVNDDRIATKTDDLIEELRETIEDTREQAPVTSFIRAALTAF